jgi:hypothetical protein
MAITAAKSTSVVTNVACTVSPRRAQTVEPRDCKTEDQRGSDMSDNQGRGVGLGTRERRG